MNEYIKTIINGLTTSFATKLSKLANELKSRIIASEKTLSQISSRVSSLAYDVDDMFDVQYSQGVQIDGTYWRSPENELPFTDLRTLNISAGVYSAIDGYHLIPGQVYTFIDGTHATVIASAIWNGRSISASNSLAAVTINWDENVGKYQVTFDGTTDVAVNGFFYYDIYGSGSSATLPPYVVSPYLRLRSQTPESQKSFKITVDDSGELIVTEDTGA